MLTPVLAGGAGKVKIGTSSKSRDGVSYLFERIPWTDDDELSSIAPAGVFGGSQQSEIREDALKHFHLVATAAQINLNSPPLSSAQINDLFAKSVEGGVPFNLWDAFVASELSRRAV